jgi:hypothetical protein
MSKQKQKSAVSEKELRHEYNNGYLVGRTNGYNTGRETGFSEGQEEGSESATRRERHTFVRTLCGDMGSSATLADVDRALTKFWVRRQSLSLLKCLRLLKQPEWFIDFVASHGGDMQKQEAFLELFVLQGEKMKKEQDNTVGAIVDVANRALEKVIRTEERLALAECEIVDYEEAFDDELSDKEREELAAAEKRLDDEKIAQTAAAPF